MEISTLGQRLSKLMDEKGLTNYKLAKDLDINKTTVTNYIEDKIKRPNNSIIDQMSKYFGVNKDWLITGIGSKTDYFIIEDPELTLVSDAHEFEYAQNNNSNSFIKLENGQYLMTMPLAEFNIQAGLLDHYQDIAFLNELSKHSIVVDKPVRGRYMAFRVKGDSMDDGTSDAIVQNSIVSTRELQRQHWLSPLRIADFPYWVIYTTQSRYPLLKEITGHDVERGFIKCHSLNDAPEYTDFELSLNDVQALFYVVDVNRQLSKKINY